MRKQLLIIATLLAVVIAACDAHAFDVKDKFMISALGGLGIPVADFADNAFNNENAGGATTGFTLGVAAEYGFTEQFLLGTRFAYHNFGLEACFLDEGGRPPCEDGSRWTVVELLSLYGKYLVRAGRGTRPYGRAGLFLGKPKLTVERGTPEWSGEYGLSLGLEVALGVTQEIADDVQFGLEGRFAHLNTNPSEPGSLAASSYRQSQPFGPAGVRDPGGNLDWLSANAYLSFGIGN